MKTIKILILIISFNAISFGQEQSNKVQKLLHEVDHLKIDKIIYYETPYIMDFNRPVETNFKTDWYNAYCSILYPLYFNNYERDANKYLSNDMQQSISTLKTYKDSFQQDYNTKSGVNFKKPYYYFYSDIYFTHLATNTKYIMSLAYNIDKKIIYPNLSKMNVDSYFNATRLHSEGKLSDNDINYILKDIPITTLFYILEGDTYKAADNINVSLNIVDNGNSDVAILGVRYHKFVEVLKSCPSFTRSKIDNGERIFEKVKYQEDEIVVLDRVSNPILSVREFQSSFTVDKGGWIGNGSVTTTLENGRLKVSGVDSPWEGIKRPLDELVIEPGKKINISLEFDKGTTNANVRLYVQELKADGSHSSWNVINGDIQTGHYDYEYTIKAGYKAILRIDKSNTHLDETTEFYVDNIVVSQ